MDKGAFAQTCQSRLNPQDSHEFHDKGETRLVQIAL